MSQFYYRQQMPILAQSTGGKGVIPVLLILCFVFGYIAVLVGGIVVDRPILLVGPPMLAILAIAYLINPIGLALTLILLRASLNPIFEEARFSSFGGLGGLVNVALIALAITIFLRNSDRIPKQIWWAWGPFLISQTIAVSYSPDKVAAIRTLIGYLATMSVLMIAFLLSNTRESYLRLAKALAVSTIPVLLIVCWAVVTGTTTYKLEGIETVSNRYAMPFAHPNILAFYCITFLMLFLYLLKGKGIALGNSSRFWLWVGLGSLLAVLLLTKTRSAWLAVAIIFMSYGVFFERRYLVYLLIAGLASFAIPEIRDRIADLGQGNEVVQYAKLNSFAWRKQIWYDGLAWMESAHYIFGYGLNSFKELSPQFFRLSGGINFGAHSIWVQLFFETGLFGFLSFAWCLIAFAMFSVDIAREDKLAKFAVLGLLAGFALLGFSDNMLDYLVSNQYLWFVVGIMLSLQEKVRLANQAYAQR